MSMRNCGQMATSRSSGITLLYSLVICLHVRRSPDSGALVVETTVLPSLGVTCTKTPTLQDPTASSVLDIVDQRGPMTINHRYS